MTGNIGETKLDDPITEFGLALLASRDGYWEAVGSAIVIGPHLALTAKHVLDYCSRAFGDSYKLKLGRLDQSFGLVALQVRPGSTGVLWCIQKFWRSPHSDLAVIQLDPFSEAAKQHRWKLPKTRIAPPLIGARVSCFGYLGGEVSASIDGDLMSVRYDCAPRTAVGTVVDVHEERRDRGMLDFPCFLTSAPFGHGMSGGPMFVDGHLNGLVCQSGLDEPDGKKRAYGTTLWPVLGTVLELSVEHEPSAPITVYELARRGYIGVVDLDRVRVTDMGDGQQRFDYRY
jgi:hypothetical protein